MDIINTAEIMHQLKKRFALKLFHTYLWNNLVILNPFLLIEENYSHKTLNHYYESIFINKQNLTQVQPHIYAFTFNILNSLAISAFTQAISISGESGSGKT